MKTFLFSLFLLFLISFIYAGDGQIDIAYSPYTISQPGSYIVVKDLTTGQNLNCISIITGNVTIDLNGHTLYGAGSTSGSTGYGIYGNAESDNITIQNGVVRDYRLSGIYLSGYNIQVSQIRVFGNRNYGIYVEKNGTIWNNTAVKNGFGGLNAGSGSVILGNSSRENGGEGIIANDGCSVLENSVFANNGQGIHVDSGSLIKDNTINNNQKEGIVIDSNTRVIGNTCNGNGLSSATSSGIRVFSTNNQIIDNLVTGNDIGILFSDSPNFHRSNLVLGNTLTNYSSSGNDIYDQMEISYCPFTITRSGSYIVTSDLKAGTNKNCIEVEVNDVTIDLNGHTLYGAGTSTGSTGNGIYFDIPLQNISVFNGTVRDFREDGIHMQGNNHQVNRIRAYANGKYGIMVVGNGTIWDNTAYDNNSDGITAGFGSVVRDNSVRDNKGRGISAAQGSTVTGNGVYNNGDTGINAFESCIVSGNSVVSNGGSYGIYAYIGSLVRENSVYLNSGDGIYAATGCTVKDNTVKDNSSNGIEVYADCQVMGNTCHSNTGAGINVTSTDNSITLNHCTDNGTGLLSAGAGNYFEQNKLSGNSTNESLGGSTEGTGELANVIF